MEAIFFQSDTCGPSRTFTTPDDKIDFVCLGEEFGLEPRTIKFCGLLVPTTGGTSDATWTQLKAVLQVTGTKADPVMVSGRPRTGTAVNDKTLSIRDSIVRQYVPLCNMDVPLCNVDALNKLLKTKLEPHLRFPVTFDYWDSLPTWNRDKLFKLAGPSEGCHEIVPLVLAIVNPPMPERRAYTEESFHHFWDTLIEEPLKFFFDGPWQAERYNSGEGSIYGARPNMVVRFGYGGWALWRGEEKEHSSSGDQQQELISKLEWTYKHLPFLMAYHATAFTVTFCALQVVVDPCGGSKKVCNDLIRFDISRAESRLDLVLASIAVAKLLKEMEFVCQQYREVSDMPLIRRDCSGKIVRPFGRMVEKTYPSETFYKEVVAIYSATLSCPNMERLLHRWDSELTIVVQRAMVAKPDNKDDLIACIRCLCEALEWLHGKGLMHRDIKWDNILRSMDDAEKWILVDHDEVIRVDECVELHPLDPSSHAPEMIVGPHGTMVDIWGIGHLLHTSDVPLDSMLTDMMERCLRPVPDQRPTAADCSEVLDHVCRSGKRCRVL